ncbi:uncharacterized protein [Garra rufa]|uniref:uncharacterized protein isoform X1 n=1 Tax=Garra rufa TaxID=137080 RepID=UPI003CCE762B
MATPCKDEFHLIISEEAQSAEVKPGSDVTIPCQLSPEISTVDMDIRWFKETDCVCLYMDGQMIPGMLYKGRVALNKEIERGNVSLELKNVRKSDGGNYLCQVTSGDRTEEQIARVSLKANEGTEMLQKTIEKTVSKQTDEKKMVKSAFMAVFTELKDASRFLENAKQEIKEKDAEIQDLKVKLLRTDAKITPLENMQKTSNDLETSTFTPDNLETKSTPQEKQLLNIEPVHGQGRVRSQKVKKDQDESESLETKRQRKSTETNEFHLIIPCESQSAEVKLGSDVTLPCHLSPEISAVDMEIRWFKETDCVCLYMDGQMIPGMLCKGRVALNKEIERGNVSLELKDVRESDSGDYLCQVISGDRTEEKTVKLSLKAHEGTEMPPKTFEKAVSKQTYEKKMVKSALMAVFTELKDASKFLENAKQEIKEKDAEIQDLKVKLLQTDAKITPLENMQKTSNDLETSTFTPDNLETKSTPQEKQLLNIEPVHGQGRVRSQKVKKDQDESESLETKRQRKSTETNEFHLIIPCESQSTEVKLGSDVTLPCHLSPEISAVDMEIRWFKETDCVCLYMDGQMIPGMLCKGRVALNKEIERGNVSLELKDVRESDSGDYLCQVISGDRTEEKTVRLPLKALGTEMLQKTIEKTVSKQTDEKKMVKSALMAVFTELKDKSKCLENAKQEIKEKDAQIQDLKAKLLTDVDQSAKQHTIHPGSCILLFENGSDEAIHFTLPSKPACPVIEKNSGHSVVVKVSPACNATEELRLLYKMKKEKDWKSRSVQSLDTVTLTDLSPDTEYEMKYTAVGKLNFFVDGDVITVTTRTTIRAESTRNTIFNKGVKVWSILTGKTAMSHKHIISTLQTRIEDLREVQTVDKSDIVMVFCPIVSRVGTDIDAALKAFSNYTETKLAVLVVIHHTFDPEKMVPESSKCVNRTDILTVDYLFYEDTGLLKCQKNSDSTDKVVNWLIHEGRKRGVQICPRQNKHVSNWKSLWPLGRP